MKPLALIRRTTIGLLGTALGLALMALAAHGDEMPGAVTLQPPVAMSAIVIHDADETLSRFCSTDDAGRMWFQMPTGPRLELIGSVADPAIANKGDGEFHAFDAAEIRSAIDHLSFPIQSLHVDVYVLPFPRRGGLESAAAPGVVLLAPGVRPLTREQQHAELVHELGHVVQYALMPDASRDAWGAYRSMRGIDDTQTYWGGAAHSNRPHEIFAEDFRALFGDALANYSGTIENANLSYPTAVSGLRDFMLDLVGGASLPTSLQALPNPSRGGVTFSLAGGRTAPLDVYDTQGRRVATLAPASGALGAQWTWDGRDDAGRRVAPGVLFARVREAAGASLRIIRIP